MKGIFYRLVKLFHFRWLFRLCRYYLYQYVLIEVSRDWGQPTSPFFFKKEADFYSWYFSAPDKGAGWLEPGMFARSFFFKGCTVLDLCCGDGFFPYMFYSDVASRIDAVDFDKDAIAHARANYSRPNIHHTQMDILTTDFPGSAYDIVIFNTALDYFTGAEQQMLLDKIIRSSKKEMILVGSLHQVKTPTGKQSENHRQEFFSEQQLHDLLAGSFGQVMVTTTHYNYRSTFFFKCSAPMV